MDNINMSIGSNIRKIRRGKDMTQEYLAELLNVSVSAVSQWESDKTAPDISLIPILCSIFHVSSDQLLGINIDTNAREIKKIIACAGKYSSRGYDDDAEGILRNCA